MDHSRGKMRNLGYSAHPEGEVNQRQRFRYTGSGPGARNVRIVPSGGVGPCLSMMSVALIVSMIAGRRLDGVLGRCPAHVALEPAAEQGGRAQRGDRAKLPPEIRNRHDPQTVAVPR